MIEGLRGTFNFRPMSSKASLHLRLLSPSMVTNFPVDWEEEANSDLFCEQSEGGVIAIQRDFIALMAAAHDAHQVVIYGLWDPSSPDGPMNFLRWALPWMLLRHSKALLHSSAFLDHRQMAHVVMGVSGAGKTTLARKALPRTILGDDMNLISFDPERGCSIGPSLLGSTFSGLYARQELFPIAAFYLPIKRHAGIELSPISQGHLLRAVLGSIANCSWPFVSTLGQKTLLKNIALALSSIPGHRLGFSLEQEVWNVIINQPVNAL